MVDTEKKDRLINLLKDAVREIDELSDQTLNAAVNGDLTKEQIEMKKEASYIKKALVKTIAVATEMVVPIVEEALTKKPTVKPSAFERTWGKNFEIEEEVEI